MKERKANRLRNFDYSSDNLYFVTSCVKNRICCFGDIKPGEISQKIVLNEYGEIAQKQWLCLAENYPYVILHAFIIMPNHIHGIIEINSTRISNSTIKIKSLSELIGAYKMTVSKQIHLLETRCRDRSRPVPALDRSRPVPTLFAWQRSFYEHIIRNEKEFKRISDYIVANPSNWQKDKFNNKVGLM